jgi:ankyrin repeat protein
MRGAMKTAEQRNQINKDLLAIVNSAANPQEERTLVILKEFLEQQEVVDEQSVKTLMQGLEKVTIKDKDAFARLRQFLSKDLENLGQIWAENHQNNITSEVIENPTSAAQKVLSNGGKDADLIKKIAEYIAASKTSGIKFETGSKNGVEALIAAARNGKLDMVSCLLESGVDINGVISPSVSTPLMIAAENGYMDVVKLLIEKGASIEGNNGAAALVAAAKVGDIQVVRLLLEKNVPVDALITGNPLYPNPQTPLMVAAQEGHIEIVKRLLQKRANVNSNDAGYTPLFRAVESGNPEIVKLILANKPNLETRPVEKTSLIFAVQKDNIEIAKLLITHKVDLNESDQHGNTALIYAIERGNEEMLNLLLNNGVNVKVEKHKDMLLPNQTNISALEYATEKGMENLLIQHLQDIRPPRGFGTGYDSFNRLRGPGGLAGK